MAWSNSKIFRAWLADIMDNTTAVDLGSDSCKAVLYDNSITPDQNVTSANSAYAAGVWSATGGQTGTPQVYHTGQWAQAGVAITTPVVNSGTSAVVFFDGDDTQSGTAATMSNIYGTHVYDDTIATPVADQGVCFNYFGGTNSVTNGRFTIVWATNGILRFTL